MNYAIEQRMRMIDFLLHHYGKVGRAALKDYFGIADACATLDLSKYRKLHPKNMVFDGSSKMYIKAPGFKRKYN